MKKTHFQIIGVDFHKSGKTEYKYTHQTACGYVRDDVTSNGDNVDCELCLKSIHMVHYHAINESGIY
jgi:hypothetical protein